MTRLAWTLLGASSILACTSGETGSIDLAARSSRCTGVQCAAGLRCHPSDGRCVACIGNADCTQARPICQAGRCVECASDDDCAAPFPVCSATLGACAECEEDTDCRVAHVCEVTEGECEDAP
jgi:hypothetical protein